MVSTNNSKDTIWNRGPGVSYLLRHCATSRTVPGSIPGGVTGDFFQWLPTEPCALESTQLLKMSTRDFSWGESRRCVRLTNCHPRSAEHEDNPGPLPTRNTLGHVGLLWETFTFTIGNWNFDIPAYIEVSRRTVPPRAFMYGIKIGQITVFTASFCVISSVI